MRYYSCRYTDADDLLAVIRRQALIAGWAVEFFGLMKSGDPRLGLQMHLSKDGLHFGLRSFSELDPLKEVFVSNANGRSGVAVHAKTGFDPALAYAAQPGFQGASKCYVETGEGGTCYIFSSDSQFFVSTQHQNGRFSTLFFGQIPTIVSNSGGQCVSSTLVYNTGYGYPLFYNHSDSFIVSINHGQFSGFDGGSRTVSSMSYPVSDGYPTMLPKSMTYGEIGSLTRSKLLNCDFPALIPVEFLTLYAGNYSPFGGLPDVFVVSLDYVNPGKVLKIGAHKFVAIPYAKKGAWVDGTISLFNAGLAVRIDE